jgi:hypothetical protein
VFNTFKVDEYVSSSSQPTSSEQPASSLDEDLIHLSTRLSPSDIDPMVFPRVVPKGDA